MDDYFDTEAPETSSSASATAATIREENSKDTEDVQMSDITVTELPPVLQIHLIRTQFDKRDKTSYKSNATVALPKRIYLDQYLESNQEEQAVRIKRMKLWKKERRVCRKMLDVKKKPLFLQGSPLLGKITQPNNSPQADATIPPADQPSPSSTSLEVDPQLGEIGTSQGYQL
jgi:hypothetical protein